jgi:phage-related protein
VDAIHIVQNNMGITGTTAREAATTIQGSVNMTKAAWSNLITGMADDNADFDSLIDNFINSAMTAADNILPRIQTIMEGLGKLITQGAKKILPVVMKTITDNLPQLIKTGVQLVVTLITGIIQALPQLVAALPEILKAIVEAFAENWPAIREAGIQLMIMLAQGIAAGLTWIGEKMMQLGTAIQTWLAQAWENVKAAAAQKWAEIGDAISEAVETIKTTFSEWVSAAGQKVTEFVETVHSGIQQFLTQIGQWIQENLIQPAEDAIAEFLNIGQHVVDNIKEGISNAWGGLTQWFNGIWQGLFGNRNVNVNVNASGNVGGYATGLDYVPYDEFPAILHKGEAVLTAAEADVWRNGGSKGGTVINQYIQSVPQTPVQLAAATAAYFEQARWAVE